MKKIILLLLIPISLFAQEKVITWDYPIVPGTTEWKSLASNAEKVSVCQIPTQLLGRLKTDELLEICLKYPLLPDIFAFSNINGGFAKFENDFNGFRQLLTRSDVSEKILLKYKSLDPGSIPAMGTVLQKGRYALSMSFLELFISHPEIAKSISNSEKKEFVRELLLKKEEKKSRPEWYHSEGMQTSYFAIVNLVYGKQNLGSDSTKVVRYIYYRTPVEAEVLTSIDLKASKYLKE